MSVVVSGKGGIACNTAEVFLWCMSRGAGWRWCGVEGGGM